MTIPSIPAEGSSAYPVLNAIVVTDLVGPQAANRQHVQGRTRTNTLRTIVNQLTLEINHITDDGPLNQVNPTVNVGSLEYYLPRNGSALMWGKLGLAHRRTYLHPTAFDGSKFHWFITTDTGQVGESTALGLKRIGPYDYQLWLRQGGILTINKVLTTGDVGAGSGLDADMLDGLESVQFLRSDTNQERVVANLCTLTANVTEAGGVAAFILRTVTHLWNVSTKAGANDTERALTFRETTSDFPLLSLRPLANRNLTKGLRIYKSTVDFSGSYMGVGDCSQGTPSNWGGQDFSHHTLQWPEDATARFVIGDVQVFAINRPDLTKTVATLSNVAGAGRECYLTFLDEGYGNLARIGFDINKNASIELGARVAASTPYIDFHSVGTSVNSYDVRLIVNGGISGTNGEGQLTIRASMVNMDYLNVTHNGYFAYIRCYTDIQAERGLFEKNVPALSDGAYSDGNLELRTNNSSLPRIGFHRAGHDAIALYYNGGTALRGRTASGWDDKLAWMSDVSAALVGRLTLLGGTTGDATWPNAPTGWYIALVIAGGGGGGAGGSCGDTNTNKVVGGGGGGGGASGESALFRFYYDSARGVLGAHAGGGGAGGASSNLLGSQGGNSWIQVGTGGSIQHILDCMGGQGGKGGGPGGFGGFSGGGGYSGHSGSGGGSGGSSARWDWGGAEGQDVVWTYSTRGLGGGGRGIAEGMSGYWGTGGLGGLFGSDQGSGSGGGGGAPGVFSVVGPLFDLGAYAGWTPNVVFGNGGDGGYAPNTQSAGHNGGNASLMGAGGGGGGGAYGPWTEGGIGGNGTGGYVCIWREN
jgi:hypothetical protein